MQDLVERLRVRFPLLAGTCVGTQNAENAVEALPPFLGLFLAAMDTSAATPLCFVLPRRDDVARLAVVLYGLHRFAAAEAKLTQRYGETNFTPGELVRIHPGKHVYLFLGFDPQLPGRICLRPPNGGPRDRWSIEAAKFVPRLERTTLTRPIGRMNTRIHDPDPSPLDQLLGTCTFGNQGLFRILASPECSSHTCAKGAGRRSEVSRATALHVVTYAAAFRPRWLVMENVVHMRPWSRYKMLIAGLQRLGYHVAEQVLEASDFGVAQSRRRLFVVADRKQVPSVVRGKALGRKPSARSVLDPAGTWRTSPLFKPGRAQATLDRAQRGFDALGIAASFLIVYYSNDGSGGWQSLGRPLRTVTTVDRFALIDPGQREPTMRMLQVPELRRAMGFEDTFELPCGTRRDRVHLLGNGVCPPVMEAVVHALMSNVDRRDRSVRPVLVDPAREGDSRRLVE